MRSDAFQPVWTAPVSCHHATIRTPAVGRSRRTRPFLGSSARRRRAETGHRTRLSKPDLAAFDPNAVN